MRAFDSCFRFYGSKPSTFDCGVCPLIRFLHILEAMNFDIDILYQDEALLAINKPAGLLSAPDRYDAEAPVAARELEGRFGRLWPVHRLDLDTSGCLLFARNEDAHRSLSMAFEEGQVNKVYHAVVRGRPAWEHTVCELSLTPDGDRKHRTIIDGAGKPSCTEFTVLGRHGQLCFIEAKPKTGRTHQVRVHLAALACPIVCDPLYGTDEPLFLSKLKKRWKGDEYTERPIIFRTALHAFSIKFEHPTAGPMQLQAPYPKDMRALLHQLFKR